MSPRPDVVFAAILQSKFEAVVAEMEATLANTACSSTISVARHCATALFTEQGQLIAVSNPLYMYPMAMTVATVIDYFQYDLAAEDVLLTNDPYGGGARLQTFTLVAPVAYGDSITLYVAVCGHTEDFAGNVRGNLDPSATELWAEAVRCTPVRLVREGKLRKDLLQTLSLNSRNPGAFELDVDAMRAAVEIGRTRLGGLLDGYGSAPLLKAVEWSLDYSERRMKALIEQIPSGRHEGSSVLAHDAHGGLHATVRAALVAGDGALTIDFTGTDAQSQGFVNASRSISSTFALLPLIAAFGGEVPCNAGSMRCVKVIAPEGSLVNPTYPAPTGWGLQHIGCEIAEAVGVALDRALPGCGGRVAANAMLLFSIHHLARHGQTVEQAEVFDFSSFVQGDADATAHHDGWGLPGIAARVPLPSVELYEASRGGRVERFEYQIDSAGAGMQRGSPGTVAVLSLPRPAAGEFRLTAVVVPRTDTQQAPHGGQLGSGNSIQIRSGEMLADAIDVLIDWPLREDATVTITMGGGAGWGEPFARTPEQVLTDVADGLVSVDAARSRYGVKIEMDSLVLDRDTTARLRRDSETLTAVAEPDHD
ncbi:Acetophenone carboxylase delta subunit [Paraburkholderia domus]|uniref:hydantoinase B/oxoprolinase family protein n=1 Tax=Paraburkholderia domus TaxID=2793075 RepID=UPI001911E479|nr:hydantoinase B/oxoprolinase family protein [Paraburkholderia domus]MBK5050492.1 hydantoinase B/oxoprolinase family protein [Burkholderia sp. R-70006]CAE6753850.1 Acetophenone carboxylase delta subunit [Paraburkholderia domus]